jgi:uncharacterized protein YjbJ (UPF0337 family)
MSMNQDPFSGTGKNFNGQVEEGFGRVTGDVKTEVEGKMKQAAGAAQDLYGQVNDVAGDAARSVQEQAAPLEELLRNTIETRPYTAVAVGLGLGGSSAARAAVRITDAAGPAALQRDSWRFGSCSS